MRTFPCNKKLAAIAAAQGWVVFMAAEGAKRPFRIGLPLTTTRQAQRAWQRLVSSVSTLECTVAVFTNTATVTVCFPRAGRAGLRADILAIPSGANPRAGRAGLRADILAIPSGAKSPAWNPNMGMTLEKFCNPFPTT